MEKQVQLILFIVGICLGEFNLAESIGQYLGNFEYKKIKDLLNFSMSSFSKISEQFGDKKKLFSLVKQGAKMSMQVGSQMTQDKATNIISKSTGISEKSIQKTANVISDIATNGPIEVLYGVIFKKFDKDNTGKIDYHEFVEL